MRVNITNSCHLDTTRHHPAAAVAGTVVAEVGTADSTGHTVVERNQVGCRLPAVEHYKPQPYAQILHDICPSDMTAYTPSALISILEVPSYEPSIIKSCIDDLRGLGIPNLGTLVVDIWK
ncbi:hypothetical protein Tco_1107730 [Tanacetum coccineum]